MLAASILIPSYLDISSRPFPFASFDPSLDSMLSDPFKLCALFYRAPQTTQIKLKQHASQHLRHLASQVSRAEGKSGVGLDSHSLVEIEYTLHQF
jgi:hypothetical protein